ASFHPLGPHRARRRAWTRSVPIVIILSKRWSGIRFLPRGRADSRVPSRRNDRSRRSMINVLLLVVGLGPCGSSPRLVDADPPAKGSMIARLRREAEALEPLVATRLAKDFLKVTSKLPAIAPRTLFFDELTKTWLTEAGAGSLTQDQRRALKPIVVDESFYYTTKYGSPLAYARPLDLP